MPSLFNASDATQLVERIRTLAADSHPAWGKLNCPQMLSHCTKPFAVASGELRLKRGLIGILFGKWAKQKFITRGAPFARNSPTDPKFLDHAANDFAAEQARLIAALTDFAANGPRTGDPHPFFGPLTRADWDTLLSKHLDHHLTQFGA